MLGERAWRSACSPARASFLSFLPTASAVGSSGRRPVGWKAGWASGGVAELSVVDRLAKAHRGGRAGDADRGRIFASLPSGALGADAIGTTAKTSTGCAG